MDVQRDWNARCKVWKRLRREEKKERRKARLDQVVLDRIAGGSAARGDPDLAVDHGKVPVDGATADDELFGYLSIG